MLLWGLGVLCGGDLGGLSCSWGQRMVWGWGGVPLCVGDPGGLSSAGLRGLRRLCWRAVALNQLPIFITAVHTGPRSWKAYHKGHIFNTSFNLTILHI